eukprot:Hpha_TRINITY_DN9203_c0_g1::TRINITY_DN9203_c0_g1_i1::g.28579::m.28579
MQASEFGGAAAAAGALALAAVGAPDAGAPASPVSPEIRPAPKDWPYPLPPGKRRRTSSAARSVPGSGSAGRCNRFQPPTTVFAVDEHGTEAELVTLVDVLRHCGNTAYIAEPDTPMRNSSSSIATSLTTGGGGGGAAQAPDKAAKPFFGLESVITPASFARLRPVDEATLSLALHVRDLQRMLGTYDLSEDKFMLEEEDRLMMFESGMAVLRDAQRLMQGEPVLVDVASDAYVFGDVHGNYRDLDFFLTELVPFDVRLLPYRLVFLGDYVDRGEYSVHCLLRLLALKVSAPESIVMLRGNHEDPAVCGRHMYGDFSFAKQCLDLFGAQRGEEFYQQACDCFSRLPIAAVIDDRIFCSHGGFPRVMDGTQKRVDILRDEDFPRLRSMFGEEVSQRSQVEDADQAQRFVRQWTAAYDTLWSDPADQDEGESDAHGFTASQRGGIGVAFTSRAVDRFLSEHRFDLLIRAHQEKRAGLRLSQNNRVITVFSTSDYQGHGNGAGVVLVRKGGNVDLIVKFSQGRCAPVPTLEASMVEEQNDDFEEVTDGPETEDFTEGELVEGHDPQTGGWTRGVLKGFSPDGNALVQVDDAGGVERRFMEIRRATQSNCDTEDGEESNGVAARLVLDGAEEEETV